MIEDSPGATAGLVSSELCRTLLLRGKENPFFGSTSATTGLIGDLTVVLPLNEDSLDSKSVATASGLSRALLLDRNENSFDAFAAFSSGLLSKRPLEG